MFSSELTVIIKVALNNDLNAICIKTEELLISEEQLQTRQSVRKEARLNSLLSSHSSVLEFTFMSVDLRASFI